jgi:hypothetical protein
VNDLLEFLESYDEDPIHVKYEPDRDPSEVKYLLSKRINYFEDPYEYYE